MHFFRVWCRLCPYDSRALSYNDNNNSMNTFFHGQSVSSIGSDATCERNQETVDGESPWSADPSTNGHSLSLTVDHHNGYLKGKAN